MRVVLAGMNVDLELLALLRERLEELLSALEEHPSMWGFVQHDVRGLRTLLQRSELTPETISAAYARISRDPRDVTTLRRIARKMVRRARRSNRTIVFEMGHGSIAEHAVFNIDLIGISRLAAEEVQSRRLVSFTEKSQRYIRLEGSWVLPPELADEELRRDFEAHLEQSFARYREVAERLEAYWEERAGSAEAPPPQRASEDARYLLPLATATQMGMTINARNLEVLVRRLAAWPLDEHRRLASALLQAVGRQAPSLIRHLTPTPYDRLARRPCPPAPRPRPAPESIELVSGPTDVALLEATPDGERRLAALLRFARGREPHDPASLGEPEIRSTLLEVLSLMGPHDAAPREFEHVTYRFAATISASCYAQLKRHRMSSLITQAYQPNLGAVLPPAVAEAGLEASFRESLAEAEAWYATLEQCHPGAGAYALTNAHRRRIVLHLSLRELYHLSRLRQDAHAQWEIRELAHRLVALAREQHPVATALLAGKDTFDQARARLRDLAEASSRGEN
jgi:flavin-dependent thymidylate synthase